MNGMLGLSMRPLASAVRLAGTSSAAGGVRWFRTNVGTIDYVTLSQNVTLSDDFEITVTSYVSSVPTSNRSLFGGGTGFGPDQFTCFLNTLGKISLQLPRVGGGNSYISVDYTYSVISETKISRANGFIKINHNGLEAQISDSNIDDLNISRLLAWGNSLLLSGIVADLRIKSAGQLVHHWPMNEESGDIHYDIVGGNHGTIINGEPEDRERFESMPGSGEWLARELTGTPDSVGVAWLSIGGGMYSANGNIAAYSGLRFPNETKAGRYRCSYEVVSMENGGVSFDLSNSDVWDFMMRSPGYKRSQVITSPGGRKPLVKVDPDGVFTIKDISVRRILEIV